jgi:hypothetical protein
MVCNCHPGPRRSSFAICLSMLLLSLSVNDGAAQDSEIKKLIDAVKLAPPLYRTAEANDYFSRVGSSDFSSGQQNRDAAIEGLRAIVKLGDMGQAASEAIPTLVDLFPRMEHVAIKRSVHYTPGNGSLEDWVQTYLVNEKNNFVFSSPFVEYATITKCENWIEALPVTTILSKKTGKGGKILDAVADIVIILRVNAGACALVRITGSELGTSQESWQKWYRQSNSAAVSRDVSPTPQPMAQKGQLPFPEIVVNGKYKIHLITGDELIGTITSRDDSSLVLKNSEGVPYRFRAMLIDKFESLAASEPEAVPDKGAPFNRPDMGALGFDDLLKDGMINKMLEIRIKNGSIFKGTLTQVNGESARINIEGSEISVSRSVIIGIRILTK